MSITNFSVNFEDLIFTREGNNLIVTGKNGEVIADGDLTSVTYTDFFGEGVVDEITTADSATAHNLLNEAVINVDIAGDYTASNYKENYTISGNNTITFNVGVGDTTISLGELDASTNFKFTDPQEGYVSQYMIRENLADNSVTITRITGQPTSTSKGLPINNLTTDHITITDYLTNGRGKVFFDGLILANEEATVSSLEDAIGFNINTLQMSTISVTAGEEFHGSFLSEKIKGTSNADVIYAGEGNDNVDGGSGNDTIYGTAGHNSISGGNGNDLIYAGKDGDSISGGYGNDTIWGGTGNDTIVSTSFNPSTGNDSNEIHAGAGDDMITVSGAKGSTVNTIWTDEGHDTILVSGVYGSQIIKDATSDDLIQHTYVSAGADYSYERVGDNLVITQTSGANTQTITLENLFVTENALDTFQLLNSDKTVAENISLLNDVVVGVNVSDGETYTATDYKESLNLAGAATIIGAKSTDTLTLDGVDELAYSRNGDDLIINNNVILKGYFTDKNAVTTVNNTTIDVSSITEITIDANWNDLKFFKNSNNLIIKNIADDTVLATLTNYFKSTSGRIDTLKLTDGDYSLAESMKDVYFEGSAFKPSTYDNGINYYGTDNDDVINSATQTSYNVYAGEGNDKVTVNQGGIYEVYGGSGNDTISVGKGTHYVEAGDDNDTIYTSGVSTSEIHLGSGDDYVSVADTGSGNVIYGDGGSNIYSFSGLYGEHTIKDATSSDILLHLKKATAEYNDFSKFKFSRNNNNLVITLDGTRTDGSHAGEETHQTITMEDFFISENPIDTFKMTDVKGQEIIFEKSILNDAEINVALTDGQEYTSTPYKEIITGSGIVEGLTDVDKVKMDGVVTYTRAENNLIMSNGTDTIEVKGFFTEGNTFDTVVSNDTEYSILNDVQIYVNDVNDYDGTVYHEIITGTSGNDIINGNDGNDAIVGGAGNDKLYGGAGQNKYTFRAGDGNDIIYSTQDGSDTIEILGIDNRDDVSFEVKGNDVIIEYSDNDNITLKNYLKTSNGKSVKTILIKDSEGNIIDAIEDFDKCVVDPTKDTTEVGYGESYTGTTLAETFIGAGNNTIFGGGGNDVFYTFAGSSEVSTQSRKGDKTEVYSGTGSDTITAGLGKDTYFFLNGHGEDTVVLNADAQETNLVFSSDATLSFNENGRDLVITNAYDVTGRGGKPNVSETVVLKDYLDNAYKNVYINDGSGTYTELVTYLQPKTFILGNSKETEVAQNIVGSQLNEVLYGGTQNDTIKSGAGDDVLVGKKGSDRLYGNSKGTKTFQFGLKHGADIVFNSKSADTIKFSNVYNGDNMKYSREGENLVIEYNSYMNSKGTKMLADKIYLANYFTQQKANALSNIEFADGSVINLQEQSISYTSTGEAYDTVYNDVITGTDGRDVYYVNQGGHDIINDNNVKASDTYNVDLTKVSSLTINDGSGTNDKLIFENANKSDIVYGLNITNTGLVKNNSLLVFTEGLDSYVEINKFFTRSDDDITKLNANGTGKIEKIRAIDGNMSAFDTSKVAQITSDVSAWLSAKDYTDTMDVFSNEKTSGDIQALIAIYQNAQNPMA